MNKKNNSYMWIIKNKGYGYYYSEGLFFTRESAIREHIEDGCYTWKQCYRYGDRAVKVLIKEIA